MGKIYIGTSGYSYFHWRAIFYPQDLPSYKWLEYYTKFFDTVELNVTFYRLPQRSAFRSWYKRVPKNFLYVIKGSRFITHIKKLNFVKKATVELFNRAKNLKEKLGVILWQFAPAWRVNLERLNKFLQVLKKYPYRYAFEFRNESWFVSDVYKILRKFNAALVLADSPRFPKIEEITADFVYIRLHGGKVLYGSEYSDEELKSWAGKIKVWRKKKLDVYVYFNNDFKGFAIKNAQQLLNLLNPNSVSHPRV